MKLSTFEIDQNKAAAINELNTYLNRVVPQLIERAKQGYKVKADGKLFAKDSADFTAIYSKDKPKRVRFYIEWSKHSGLSFKTDRSYDLSDSNTYYVEFGYLDKYVNGEAVFKDLPTDKSAENISICVKN